MSTPHTTTCAGYAKHSLCPKSFNYVCSGALHYKQCWIELCPGWVLMQVYTHNCKRTNIRNIPTFYIYTDLRSRDT